MKIRIKVMIPLFVSVLLLGISFIWVDSLQRREGIRESVSRTAAVFEKLIEAELRATLGIMETALSALVRDPVFLAYLREENREKIVEYASPIFAGLKSRSAISHFYFHRPDRVNFIRLHELDHSGDRIDRETLKRAEATGASSFGVEQGPTGASVLRLVDPVRRGDSLVGYLELGVEFQDIVSKIEKIIGVTALVLADKANVKREYWEKRNNKTAFRSSWDFMEHQVVMASSLPSIPGELSHLKLQGEEESAYVRDGEEVVVDGRPHSVIVVPFLGAEKKKMADIVLLYDSSEIRSAARRSARMVWALVISVVLLLSAFFYIFLGRVEKVIEGQQQAIISSSKMASLGEMAGGVAHEINNPLAIIKSTSEQIQELLDEEALDRPMLKKMAGNVEATVDRMANIVKGLRAFSRDGSKDPYQRVRVRQLIGDTLALCGERLRTDGIAVQVESFDESLSLDGRFTELSQVLLNLLNNARDAIVALPEKWIKISASCGPDWIEIRVTDSGKGIPAGLKEKIFEPFFTTKEIGKGTGLGLSLSSGFIRSHGGKLFLDSMGGHTSFVIRLPRSQA